MFICADNTILVTSMSSTGSSLKDGYNVLPNTNKTITITDSSDALMEESKPNEEGEDVSDDISEDPIFKVPAQRLTIKQYTNLNLPNKYNILGKKRLSTLETSAIQQKNIRAISNDQKLNDPSILAINILTMTPGKINFITKVNISKIKTG